MILKGKIVTLRAVEEEDLEMLRELSNSPDFEKMVIGWALPISKNDQKKWFENCKNDSSIIRYIIETKEDGAVGMVGFRDIDWKNGTASGLGMRVAKTNLKNKGIATDAMMTLLRYGFEELRLHRINGRTLEYNGASLHVLQKVGYKIEGTQRQVIFKNGKYNDIVILGCLKSDYEKLVSENHYWDSEE